MQKNDIIDKVRNIVSNILQDNGIELIDITYRRESSGNILRILADTARGITIGECAKMNEMISSVLDESVVIEDRYILEVSSPGLDRPLKSKNDFLKAKGKKVRICTYAPINNRKEFIGSVEEVNDNSLTVLTDKGVKISIAFEKMSSAKLDF